MRSQIFFENINHQTKQISIIIPIANYNIARKFIFEYLIQAPLTFEFILVFDVSDSEVILMAKKELKNVKNTQIIAIECYVKSPGLARNIGLDYASGLWIAFWDCDDKVNFSLFCSEHKLINDSRADIIIWNFQKVTYSPVINSSSLILHDSSMINVAMNPGIWRMVFKRNFIIYTKFTNLLWGEDQLYFCSLLLLNPMVTFRDESFYEYQLGNSEQLTARKINVGELSSAYEDVNTLLRGLGVGRKELRQVIQIILMRIFLTRMRYSRFREVPKLILNLLSDSDYSDFIDKVSVLLLLIVRRNRRSIKLFKGEIIISLTGGLGNQLFQYAAGNFIAQRLHKNILFEREIGRPRVNERGIPSIFSLLDENENPTFTLRKSRYLFRRITNLMLRVFLQQKKSKFNQISRIIVTLAIGIISRTGLTGIRKFRIFIPRNLGYEDIIYSGETIFLRGYFQTYKYLENARLLDCMMRLRPISTSLEFEQLSSELMSKRVLIVHVRLSDYVGLEEFGIPSMNYYLGAIDEVNRMTKVDEIWVFSDQTEVARNWFETAGVAKIKFIENFSRDDSQIWELMRHGSSYVIGNSSFAWWAATLSYNANPVVICPVPWFKGIEEPRYLIPPTWLRHDAKFK
jgi:glycosyltransferase involved in cell wall biosynthesis